MERDFVKDIVDLVRGLQKRMETNLPIISSEISDIIVREDRSAQRIERLLDTLLDYGQMNIGKEEFLRLNGYYSTVNRENSSSYDRFYKEMNE